MSLHKRLLWVHKTYSPEVFLRTFAVIQGQHGGGQLGRNGLTRTPWDVLAPEYAIGLNDLPSRQEPEDLATLQQQADAIADWIRSGDDSVLEIVDDDMPVRSTFGLRRSVPDDSPFARVVPWVAKLVNDRVKRKDKALKAGRGGGPAWFDGRQDVGTYPILSATDNQLREARWLFLRFWEGSKMDSARWPGRALSQSPVSDEDVILANDLTLLSQSLRNIRDWVVGARGVDIMRFQLHDAVHEADDYHAELRRKRKAEGARGEQGAVIQRWPDGWTMQLLQTSAQLKAEGQAMGHCVGDGGYDGDLTGILSLRDPKGDPHVTIELELDEDSWANHYMEADNPLVPPHLADVLDQKSPPEPHLVYRNRYGDSVALRGGYVMQVVGKGNEAPHPKYVDYVADALASLNADAGEYGWLVQDAALLNPDKELRDLMLESERRAPGLFTAQYVLQAIRDANDFPGLVRAWMLLRANEAATDGVGQAYWRHAVQALNERIGGGFSFKYAPEVVLPLLRGDLEHARSPRKGGPGRVPDTAFRGGELTSWWDGDRLTTLEPYLPLWKAY